jgi:hypothetical protein
MAASESERARENAERGTGEALYLGVTRIFSVVIIGFGLAIVVVTLAAGGGPASAGFLIGLLFTAIGAARLYIARRPRN